jgi:hypothetical protein
MSALRFARISEPGSPADPTQTAAIVGSAVPADSVQQLARGTFAGGDRALEEPLELWSCSARGSRCSR